MLFVTACSPGAPVPDNIPPDESTDLSIYTDRKIAVDHDTANKIYQGTTTAVFNNVLYLAHSSSVYKYLLTSSEETMEPIPLCPDSLCQHNTKSCPLYLPMHEIILIDEEASKSNNNMPIFYLLYESAIKKYDSATNKLEVIYDPSGVFFSSMWLYDDKLYITYGSDSEYLLARMDKNGDNLKIFSRENGDLICRYIGFDEKYAYYYDTTNKVYRVNFDENQEEYLFTTDCGFGGKIYNGYLYYGNTNAEYVTEEGSTSYVCSLYRIKTSQIGITEPQLIDTGIMHSSVPFIFISDGKILYAKRNMIKKGEISYKVDNEIIVNDVYSTGSNKMYRYNPDTQKIDIAFEDSGYNLLIFSYMDSRFFISRVTSYEFNESGERIEAPDILFYDYINDTKQYLEYPVFVRPERN